MEIKDYEEMVAKLKEELQAANNKTDSLTRQLEVANAEVAGLKTVKVELEKKYEELQQTATSEIERLSLELADSKSIASQSALTVTVKKAKYTTPTGRKYNIEGALISAEQLVKNQELCEKLIEMGSHIFTKV